MTPRPPCWAMAMASLDSVTVSIAALAIGTLSRMCRVNAEVTSTWEGSTVECRGTEQDVVERQRGGQADGDLVNVENIRTCFHSAPQKHKRAAGVQLPSLTRRQQTSCPFTHHGIFCISCRCRKDRDRCGRPSALPV